MNESIEIGPTDGPLTVYVVAVLFERRVAPSGTWGTGYGAESALLQHQFARPGEHPLNRADAAECGIQSIRKQWAAVMGPQSEQAHFAVSRVNVNGTVIRSAPLVRSTDPAESSEPQEDPHPVKRRAKR